MHFNKMAYSHKVKSGSFLIAVGLALSGLTLAQGPDAAIVQVANAEMSTIDPRIRITANVRAANTSELSPRVDGLVREIHMDVGSRVKEGDLLLHIDDELAKLEMAELEASVRETQARYENSLRLEKELESLIGQSHVSKTNFATQQSETKASFAALEGLRARLAYQREVLSRHNVRAPFDAVISDRMTERGEWVRSDSPVMTLVSLSKLHVDMQVPERFLGKIREGNKVTFSSNSRPDLALKAEISLVVPVINQDTRTFLARVIFDNSSLILQPGMAVNAQISQGSMSEPVLQVPSDAIVRKADGSINVWKVIGSEPDLSAIPVPVKLGALVEDMTEITSGEITANDRVVVSGNETLQPKQPIRIW